MTATANKEAGVYFPQSYSHIAHCFNPNGLLRTALITGGDRLVILKQGSCVAASAPLFTNAAAVTATTCGSSESCEQPCVQCLCICVCNYTIHIAVATSAGIFLFALEDADIIWQGCRGTSGGASPGMSGSHAPQRGSAGASNKADMAEAINAGSTGGLSCRYLSVLEPCRASRVTSAATPSSALRSSSGWKSALPKLAQRRSCIPPTYAGVEYPLLSSSSSSPRPLHDLSIYNYNDVGSSANNSNDKRQEPLVLRFETRRCDALSIVYVGGRDEYLCVLYNDEVVLVSLAQASQQQQQQQREEAPEGGIRGYSKGMGSNAQSGCNEANVVRGVQGVTSAAASNQSCSRPGAAEQDDALDCIVWRSVGAYRMLAVCPTNYHIALVLQSSTIVVFANKWVRGSCSVGDDERGGEASSSSSLAATPSPMHYRGGRRNCLQFASKGLTASLGTQIIEKIEWHHVSAHMLLCVTCGPKEDGVAAPAHPKDWQTSRKDQHVTLYTVQSLKPARRYTNIVAADGAYQQDWVEDRGGGDAVCSPGDINGRGAGAMDVAGSTQLVPCGSIPLAHAPSATAARAGVEANGCSLNAGRASDATAVSPVRPHFSRLASGAVTSAVESEGRGIRSPPAPDAHVVLTSIVPRFSLAPTTQLLVNKLELLHIHSADGTIRTSSYRFGRQKHTSFAKQRAAGLFCRNLLLPLYQLYGELRAAHVLPLWKSRPIELGKPTPQTAQFTSVRRYRFVAYFASGVVAAVMVDLTASIYRVEGFLALGCCSVYALSMIDASAAQRDRIADRQQRPLEDAGDTLVAGLLCSGTDDGESAVPCAPIALARTPTHTDSRGRTESDTLAPVLGRCKGVVLFSQRNIEEEGGQRLVATALMIAPLCVSPTVDSDSPLDIITSALLRQIRNDAQATADTKHEANPITATAPALEGEAQVLHFMEARCPEKVKLAPALLRSVAGDTARLLKQLEAKYGPLDPQQEEQEGKSHSTAAAAAAASPIPSHAGTVKCTEWRLTGGVASDDGVLLHLEASILLDANIVHQLERDTVKLQLHLPPCELESLGPVQALVSCGGARVPMAAHASVILEEPEATSTPAAISDRHMSDEAEVTTCVTRWEASAEGSPLSFSPSASSTMVVAVEVNGPLLHGGREAARVIIPAFPGHAVAADADSDADISAEKSSNVTAVLASQAQLLVNNDTIAAVLLQRQCVQSGERFSELRLYGLPAVQFIYAPAAAAAAGRSKSQPNDLVLECVLEDVIDFYIGDRGEVIVLRRHVEGSGTETTTVQRWLRCFPSSSAAEAILQPAVFPPAVSGTETRAITKSNKGSKAYRYVLDSTWPSVSSTPPALCAITCLPTVEVSTHSGGRRHHAATQFIGASARCDYLRSWYAQCNVNSPPNNSCAEVRLVAQYHPDVVMQLISLGQWQLLKEILHRVAAATSTAVAATATATASASAVVRTMEEVKEEKEETGKTAQGSDKGTPKRGASSSLAPLHSGELVTAEDVACTLCHGALPQALHAFTSADAVADHPQPLSPLALDLDGPEMRAATAAGASDEAAGNNTSTKASRGLSGLFEVFAEDTVLEDLALLLPQVTLSRLGTRSQLALLCVVESLSATRVLARSVDEAAARYFLFYTLAGLRKRLRLPGYEVQCQGTVGACVSGGGVAKSEKELNPSSILVFATGKTASRMVITASYLWAAMSDSQAVLLEKLFPPDSTRQPQSLPQTSSLSPPPSGVSSQTAMLSWAEVEASGVAYWAQTAQQLRVLAERVAKAQYLASKDIPSCALMYAVAGKVATLAALCKLQNNPRLHTFFSRDFTDEHNRSAASANAFAAVGKNMPLYGAAFFVLAGDVRSAAQVIMQRYGNPLLALFVLRATAMGGSTTAATSGGVGVTLAAASTALPSSSSPSAFCTVRTQQQEDIQWYMDQRTAEAASCGDLDMWEQACLAWVMGPTEAKVAALRRLAAHTTSHPEVLSALRYARDRVSCLAHRGSSGGGSLDEDSMTFLPASRELICLLRLGRYCLARQLQMCAVLHYSDAQRLLERVLVEAQALDERRKQQQQQQQGRKNQKLANSKFQGNFDTGTLVFKGFGDSDDEEEKTTSPSDGLPSSVPSETQMHLGDDTETSADFELSQIAVQALREELHYAQRSLSQTRERHSTGSASDDAATGENRSFGATESIVLANVKDLLLCAVQGGGFAQLESRLTKLVKEVYPLMWLTASQHQQLQQQQELGKSKSDDGSGRLAMLLVSMVRLLLSEMAAYTRNYLVAAALHHIRPLTDPSQFSSTNAARAVADFMTTLYDTTVQLRALMVAQMREKQAEEAQLVLGGDDVGRNGFRGSSNNEMAHASGEDAAEPVEEPVHKSIWDTLLPSNSDPTTATMTTSAAGDTCVEGTTTGVGTTMPTRAGAVPLPQSTFLLSESEQVASVFAWFSLGEYMNACRLWRQCSKQDDDQQQQQQNQEAESLPNREDCAIATATSLRAVQQQQVRLQCHLLLCCGACYATLRFNMLAEETYTRLSEAEVRAGGGASASECIISNSNGLYIETEGALRDMMELLSAKLASTPVTLGFSSPVASSALMLQQLCYSYLALFQFNAIPVASAHVSTAAYVALLRVSCAAHAGASHLLQALEDHDEGVEEEGMCGASGGGSSRGKSLGLRSSSEFFLLRHSSDALAQLDDLDPSSTATENSVVSTNPVLRAVEAAWLRRHHTHGTLRRLLLRLCLRGGLADFPLPTDRLLLSQSSHSILHVDFDRSSCDSVVWSTEAGTGVTHGFREVLAGDNEHVLLSQMPERNIATEVFSAGLSMQLQRLHLGSPVAPVPASSSSPPPVLASSISSSSCTSRVPLGPTAQESTGSEGAAAAADASKARQVLLRRPLLCVSARAMLSSHPHLPFFIAGQQQQQGGNIDLYPFASNEAVATFQCPRRTCTATQFAYSHNGYLFACGLQDGSVACYRFTATALGCTPCFYYARLFVPPSGPKAVLFCGARASLLVAVGVIREPHVARRVKLNSCLVATMGGGGGGGRAAAAAAGTLAKQGAPRSPSEGYITPKESALHTPTSSSSLHAATFLSPQSHQRRSAAVSAEVGEIVVLDTTLYPGDPLVRCALPFVPEYAVYIAPLDAVLCVSSEGLMAVYQIYGDGGLTVIGEASLQAVLRAGNSCAASSLQAQTGGGVLGAAALRFTASPSTPPPPPTVTCVAVSAFDNLVALGTSDGAALVLTIEEIGESIAERKAFGKQRGEEDYYYTQSSAPGTRGARSYLEGRTYSVLSKATMVHVAPQRTSHSAVEDLVFTPSVLLAGLRDGKLVAAVLIPHVLRQLVTTGRG